MIPDVVIYALTGVGVWLLGSVFARKKQRIEFINDVQSQELAKQMLSTHEGSMALAGLLAERGINSRAVLDNAPPRSRTDAAAS